MDESKTMKTETEGFLGQQNQKAPAPVRNNKIKGAMGKTSANIFFYTMVALPILQFIIFYIVVNFNSILLAFKQYEVVPGKGYVTNWIDFGNFETIFSDF